MEMEFDVERKDEGPVSILRIGGYLDAHSASAFEEGLQALVDDGRYSIVIDFGELNYVSSAGLGVIMGFVHDVREHGGDIKLAAMDQKVFRIFDLVGFPRLYEFHERVEDAAAAFTSNLDKPGTS